MRQWLQRPNRHQVATPRSRSLIRILRSTPRHHIGQTAGNLLTCSVLVGASSAKYEVVAAGSPREAQIRMALAMNMPDAQFDELLTPDKTYKQIKQEFYLQLERMLRAQREYDRVWRAMTNDDQS
jgi:hypothetical protein